MRLVRLGFRDPHRELFPEFIRRTRGWDMTESSMFVAVKAALGGEERYGELINGFYAAGGWSPWEGSDVYEEWLLLERQRR